MNRGNGMLEKEREMNMARRVLTSGCVWAMAMVLAGPSAHARVAKSVSYDLEYGITGAGGGKAQSAGGTYSVAGVITMEGCTGKRSASAAYVVEPVVGAPAPVRSSVGEWMLY